MSFSILGSIWFKLVYKVTACHSLLQVKILVLAILACIIVIKSGFDQCDHNNLKQPRTCRKCTYCIIVKWSALNDIILLGSLKYSDHKEAYCGLVLSIYLQKLYSS
jgi:hypothetical protein